MKIYTKSGDEGKTTTYAGKKVDKDHPVVVAGLKFDYVHASMDSCKSQLTKPGLLDIMSFLEDKFWQSAGEVSLGKPGKKVKDYVQEEDLEYIEQLIDRFNPKTSNFLRFQTESATRLNELRVRVRDLEVFLTRFLRKNQIRPLLYKFINRTSDLIYVLACVEEERVKKQK